MMKMVLVIGVLFVMGSRSFCLAESVDDVSPRVHTRLGTIEGYYDTAYRGQKFEAYEGIPFAQPPVGQLRFEVARSVTPWKGVLQAKQFGSPCFQYNILERNPLKRLTGSEDCLYLNVYTPVKKNRICKTVDLQPVIFFITGGGFIYGAGSDYKPHYLLDRNVTLVTINYRLGPLGFLNTEDAIVPGNMGLKDQAIALRWVKDNIEHFGGDPSRITIVGQSAGGASVHYHYLTKLSDGLFQGGISLSGTAIAPWAFVKCPLTKAQQLADEVGCPTGNNRAMVDCLKAKPVEEIVDAVSRYPAGAASIPFGFGPSVEKGSSKFTFIDRAPMDIIASGDIKDIPWVTGVVSDEGLFPMASYLVNETSLAVLNDNWKKIAPYLLYYTESIPKIDQSQVGKLIKEHYFGEKNISRATFDEAVHLISDRWFFDPFEKAAWLQVQANRSPVYTYYFSYRGAHSFSELMGETTENLGVCHYDDLSYVLLSFFNATTTSEDRKMQQVLIDLWVSFATNGAPNVGVTWPRLSQSSTGKLRYMHIAGPKKIQMEEAKNFGDKSFWNTINFK